MKWLSGLLALCLMLPLPSQAGGAWPRGEGKVFASVTWSSWGEIDGYLAAMQGLTKLDDVNTQEIGTYLEYGITERLTFGLDRYHRPTDNTGASILFLRSAIGPLSNANKFSFEFGLGNSRNWQGIDNDVLRAGIAWGRGFENRWLSGWMEIDAKAGYFDELETGFYKADTTIGLKQNDKSFWMLQLQAGALDGQPGYARLVPAYVHTIGSHFSVETGFLAGMHNDESLGLKLGGWLSF